MRPRIGITSTPSVHDERAIERVNRWYVDAVLRAGGLPQLLPTMAPADAEEVLAGLDGLILTGGGDVAAWYYGEEVAPEAYGLDPARDEWELALATTAIGLQNQGAAGGGLPVLGVCRGNQVLNVAAGGTLIQHLAHFTEEQHWQRARDRDAVHDVVLEPGSRLAEILGQPRLGVNTIHHQAIARVGESFRPVARADDGIVEAIERKDGTPVIGVQWHPESLIDMSPHGQLFLWLTRTAAVHRPGLDRPESFQPAAPATTGLGNLIDHVA